MALSAVSTLSLLQNFAHGGCKQRYVKRPDIILGGEQSANFTTRVQCIRSLINIPGWSSYRKMIFPHPYHKRRVGAIQSSLQIPQYPDPRIIVLDIEGTTTPISFVTDVLFPYATNNVRNHLLSTFESDETQSDIELLRKQVVEDITNRIEGAKPIPPINANREEVVEAACVNVFNMIKADRKISALKELQGHIWRYGYAKGELLAEVFDDIPKAFQAWHSSGTKVYIYSSGSREAQRQIFGNTQYGDLRYFLSGYFDTITAGNKREAKSYQEIYLSVGVDQPSQIVFATDVVQEAAAAKQAGLRALIVSRPGNAPLPPEHGFPVVTSLLDI